MVTCRDLPTTQTTSGYAQVVIGRMALACAAVLLASGCGGYDPDMAQIERELAAGIHKQEQVDVTVECPSSVDWKPGGEFHCTADGLTVIDPVRVTVSMENDDGEYTWTID